MVPLSLHEIIDSCSESFVYIVEMLIFFCVWLPSQTLFFFQFLSHTHSLHLCLRYIFFFFVLDVVPLDHVLLPRPTVSSRPIVCD